MPQLTALTPLGDLTLSEQDGAIVALDWGRGRDQTPTPLLQRAAAARGETTPRTEHEHAFALWRQRTTHVAHTLDAQAARTTLIPDARTRAQTRLSLKPTPPPRKP